MRKPIRTVILLLIGATAMPLACSDSKPSEPQSTPPEEELDRTCTTDRDCVLATPCYCEDRAVNVEQRKKLGTKACPPQPPNAGACPQWAPICAGGTCGICVVGQSCAGSVDAAVDAGDAAPDVIADATTE